MESRDPARKKKMADRLVYHTKTTLAIIAGMLEERPGEMYVCTEYMAVWVPSIDKALFFRGDYTGKNEEELNLILQEHMAEFWASQN